MSINANNAALNEILETINGLPISKDEQEKTINITENGTTEVTPDDGMTLSKVTVNVEVENSGGEDDFIGVKYSIYSGAYYNLPKTADARSLDKILKEPSENPFNVNAVENGNCLTYAFANFSKTPRMAISHS